jgi:hypothetical protein
MNTAEAVAAVTDRGAWENKRGEKPHKRKGGKDEEAFGFFNLVSMFSYWLCHSSGHRDKRICFNE